MNPHFPRSCNKGKSKAYNNKGGGSIMFFFTI